jgi:hypothetical protein
MYALRLKPHTPRRCFLRKLLCSESRPALSSLPGFNYFCSDLKKFCLSSSRRISSFMNS